MVTNVLRTIAACVLLIPASVIACWGNMLLCLAKAIVKLAHKITGGISKC